MVRTPCISVALLTLLSPSLTCQLTPALPMMLPPNDDPAAGCPSAWSAVNDGPPEPSIPRPLVSFADRSTLEECANHVSSVDLPSALLRIGRPGSITAVSSSMPTALPSSSSSVGENTPPSRWRCGVPCSIRWDR
ncbi:hypothetical protein GCM10010431_57200 [Streptomyces kunmingensis]